jgi:nitric oxide reductase large subunit
MKYQSQKIALAYFAVALALFAVQVLGACHGLDLCQPELPVRLMPFNIARMLHTNSLVVWLLLGFFGAPITCARRIRARNPFAQAGLVCSLASSSLALPGSW